MANVVASTLGNSDVTAELAWGGIFLAWLVIAIPGYIYWTVVEMRPGESRFTSTCLRLSWTWIIGFLALFPLWGYGFYPAAGLAWSLAYPLIATAWWRWPQIRSGASSKPIEPNISRKTAARVLFGGLAGLAASFLLGDEIGNFLWRLQGEPLIGNGVEDLFYGNGAKVIFAFVTLLGGYLLTVSGSSGRQDTAPEKSEDAQRGGASES